MNWRLRLYRNESFLSGLQMFRWSTSTSMSSPIPRSETTTRWEVRHCFNYVLLFFLIFKLYISDITVFGVTYLLTALVPQVSWSWVQCSSVESLQSSAPWNPFLWPGSGSCHSGCAELVNLKTHTSIHIRCWKSSIDRRIHHIHWPLQSSLTSMEGKRRYLTLTEYSAMKVP